MTSRGHSQLVKWFEAHPTRIKAREAELLGFKYKQTLDHLLAGRRSPTLQQAIALEKRYGIPAGDWLEAVVT